jgi:hypothetical protein
VADIRLVAEALIADGWEVVPLVKGEKRASSSWQKRKYEPKHFKPDDGIAGKCGEPSQWRVDVDLDCDEAVKCAKHLLNNTGLIHGRPGKPDSHYWFICEGIKSTQFTDIRDSNGRPGGMLAEIRSTGVYTALPPSGHPSGEVLVWSIERAPKLLTPEELYTAVRDLAIATAVARHYPGAKAKHDMVGPLAGFLLQAKVEPIKVIEIVRAAATAAGDTDVADRVAFATMTVGKWRDRQPVTGGRKLAEHLSPELVAKMRGWLKVAEVDALEEFDHRHFVVRLGKDTVIGREDDEDGVVFQPRRSLDLEYANRKIVVGQNEKGKPDVRPLFQAWLEWGQRRTFRKVIFAPPPLRANGDDYNLWKGFDIEPDANPRPEDRCARLLTHLYDVVCSGNDDHYRYLLKWAAFAVQNPAILPEVAVVMRGVQGSGKGTAVRPFERIFGRHHFVQLDKLEQLTGRFNTALSGKVIVFADEAMWAGIKTSLGAVKRIITEPTLAIERKGIDLVPERNCVHLFMATNEDWAIPAASGERRFFALNVSPTKAKDQTYFAPINAEIAGDGTAAFLAYLLAYPTSAAEVRAVPMTDELRTQQELTLSAELQWWHECLRDGFVEADPLLASPLAAFSARNVNTQEIYAAYKRWIEAHHRERHLLNKNVLMTRLVRYMTRDEPKTAPRAGTRVILNFFSVAEARAYFDQVHGTTTTW